MLISFFHYYRNRKVFTIFFNVLPVFPLIYMMFFSKKRAYIIAAVKKKVKSAKKKYEEKWNHMSFGKIEIPL